MQLYSIPLFVLTTTVSRSRVRRKVQKSMAETTNPWTGPHQELAATGLFVL